MEIIDLERLFDSKLETINSTLGQILNQTTKTNGKVAEQEKRIEELKSEVDKNSWVPKVLAGLVGLILLGVGGALVKLVIH